MTDLATHAAAVTKRAESLTDWNDIVSSAFAGTHVDSDSTNFYGLLGRCRIDNFQMIRIRAQASTVESRIRGYLTAPSGLILLHLQSAGTSVTAQNERVGNIGPGAAVLCNPDDDYSVKFSSPYEMYVMKFPMAHLVAHRPDVDLARVTATILDVRLTQLLLSFVRTAWKQRECLEHDVDWCECVQRTVLDLLTRAITRSDDAGMAARQWPLRQRVLGYIQEHLANPELRTSTIADASGVSSRTVQTVFERMATTASAYILDERLKLAADRLRCGHGNITAVALDTGFNDPAYFSRCFHKQYGVAPRAYARAQGR